MSLIRIVIVAYGSAEHVLAALKSLKTFVQVPFEVVVYDNTPTALADLAAYTAEGFKYHYLHSGTNLGFGAAVNRAAAYQESASAPAWSSLLLLNPDAVLASPITLPLVNELEQQDSISGFRVYDDERKSYRQASARRFPSAMQALFARQSL